MGYYSAKKEKVTKTLKQLLVFECKSDSISFDFRLINHCCSICTITPIVERQRRKRRIHRWWQLERRAHR
jgi:hypothetical protein